MSNSTVTPPTPFPIHRLAHNYYLYSTPLITALRAKHNIPGTLIGTLPQCPQQNVFLGLPLLLSLSETRLLVQKRLAYIVDDAKAHREGLAALSQNERQEWKAILRREGEDVTRRQVERMAGNREKVLEGMEKGKRESVLKKLGKQKVSKDRDAIPEKKVLSSEVPVEDINQDNDEDEFLFSASGSTSSQPETPTTVDTSDTIPTSVVSHTDSNSKRDIIPPATPASSIVPHGITPTISYPPLHHPSPPTPTTTNHSATEEPATSSSSPTSHDTRIPPSPSSSTTSTSPLPPPSESPKSILHNYLSGNSYFLLPGLRFGCHFSAYPGDPLRFHSHFLCRGYEWEEEIDLMDLVGGGRLGTGVKKGFLVGGRVENGKGAGGEEIGEVVGEEGVEGEGKEVRCFCIEWGGM